MSNLVKDIQTIAKTDILEEKLAKALSQSDSTLNSDVSQSQIQTERSIGVADGTTNTGTTTNNSTTVVVEGGSISNSPISALGYIPAAQDGQGNPNGGGQNLSIANLAGGISASAEAAAQLASANSILNNNNTTGTNSSQSTTNDIHGATDKTNSTFSGGRGASGGGGGGANQLVSGQAIYNIATNGENDPILQNGKNAPQVQNSSEADQETFTNNYVSYTWSTPGVVTADQISTGKYPPDYNPLQNKIDSIIGFDVNDNISSVTGSILAVKVQLQNPTFPTPSSKDALYGSQNTTWTSPNILPPYADFQLAKTWSCTSPETANGSTPSQCMDNAITSLRSINPGGLYTYSWWDVQSLTPSGSNMLATWYSDKRNGSSPPNSTTITRSNCSPPASFCPLTAPIYASWPKTGAVILSYLTGSLQYNIYDSELPSYLKNPSSIITLATGDGVNIINTDLVQIQPGVNGGYLVSVLDSSGNFKYANYYDSTGIAMVVGMNATQANLMGIK